MQIAEVLRPGMVRPFLVDREYEGRLRVVVDQDEWEMLWNRLRTMHVWIALAAAAATVAKANLWRFPVPRTPCFVDYLPEKFSC
jgi:hypothetical protein